VEYGRLSRGSVSSERRVSTTLALVGTAGLAATIAAAAVTAGSVSGEGAALAAFARGAIVAVPVAVGLYAWSRPPADRFGRLLVAAGFVWFLTTLSESGDELLYSIGRTSSWVAELGLIWLILAFPTGRLSSRIDRWLVWTAFSLVALLYLPTALVTEAFPAPSNATTCDGGCPGNAFFVLDTEPAFVDSALIPIREALTVLLFLAVTARLAQRVLRASRLMRLMLGPVLAVAGGRVFVLAVALAVRRVAPDSQLVDAMVWAIALAQPALAVAFLAGLIQRRLHEAGALERLGERAREGLSPTELESVIADTVGDPTLRVVYRSDGSPGRWLDADGRPVDARPSTGQCLTEVREGGRLVAGVLHDEALRDEVDFVRAVASYALIARENRSLAGQVASSLAEVRQSRSRILASGDRERRRIERDLHDGAQQRLVALGIQLELAEELIKSDPERGLEKLHSLGGEVDKTLEEIQALARGVYPSLLADRGLAEALRAAAVRLPMAATVDPDGLGRYPADVENAVYFCCLEAMQNAAKHAGDAAAVTVALGEADGLVFEVRDNGVGFDSSGAPSGSGVTNMHDRLAALGGEVEVRSTLGEGTVVAGRIPLGPG
jgi:signal transduction histidine kinase